MRVHVIAASRHGSTMEIAEAIAATLRLHGLTAEAREIDDDGLPTLRLGSDDVVVLGSAIYAGRWVKTARRFLDRHAGELRRHRTWLFSSGPLNDTVGQAIDPTLVSMLELDTGALEHHVFNGRLDRNELTRTERLVAAAVRAPDGDFRDWDDVAAWAGHIADELAAPV